MGCLEGQRGYEELSLALSSVSLTNLTVVGTASLPRRSEQGRRHRPLHRAGQLAQGQVLLKQWLSSCPPARSRSLRCAAAASALSSSNTRTIDNSTVRAIYIRDATFNPNQLLLLLLLGCQRLGAPADAQLAPNGLGCCGAAARCSYATRRCDSLRLEQRVHQLAE